MCTVGFWAQTHFCWLPWLLGPLLQVIAATAQTNRSIVVWGTSQFRRIWTFPQLRLTSAHRGSVAWALLTQCQCRRFPDLRVVWTSSTSAWVLVLSTDPWIKFYIKSPNGPVPSPQFSRAACPTCLLAVGTLFEPHRSTPAIAWMFFSNFGSLTIPTSQASWLLNWCSWSVWFLFWLARPLPA